jgi:inorganic pyrophosphatase
MSNDSFWQKLDALIQQSEIVIDCPRGTAHPRYPEYLYPLDYGYLKATTSGDHDGIDLWRGSLAVPLATGIVVTLDLLKRDSEIKVLLGCTHEEMVMIVEQHNRGEQAGMLIER